MPFSAKSLKNASDRDPAGATGDAEKGGLHIGPLCRQMGIERFLNS